MAAPRPAEVLYRLRSRPLQGRPGQHRSRALGAGLDVHGFATLASYPDARRIDLHLSARDPFGRWLVRVPRQRSAATLVVLADLSASMRFGHAPRKQDALADLVDALGHSAWRTGDSFAFAGADQQVRQDWMAGPTRSRAASSDVARRLRGAGATGRGAAAMQAAAARFAGVRDALLFLVSDFHWPAPELDQVCAALAGRDVVPVVLWSPHEFEGWPRWGLSEVQDPETGRRRLVWFRPALADAMARAGAARRAQLRERFARQGWRAFFCRGAFDAQALNAYFLGEDRDA